MVLVVQVLGHKEGLSVVVKYRWFWLCRCLVGHKEGLSVMVKYRCYWLCRCWVTRKA